MSFYFIKSHRSEILKKVAFEHKELNDSRLPWLNKCLNILSQRDKHWLVFIIVLVLLLILTIVQFDAFTYIVLQKKSAEILIDQRTSNVATIISMTLAVIGLLLSNLAVKDNQTYKLLFVNSKLYLIIYYTLSVIFCLIIISTLRDTVEPPFYQRLVVAGTYLALFILIGIGYLFRTIINFTNVGKIQSTLSEQLMIEAKQNLRIVLISKYSQVQFQQFLVDNGIQSLENSFINDRQISGATGLASELLIYDINFKKLKSKLDGRSDFSKPHYYSRKLHINMVTKDYNNFIWPVMNETATDRMDFTECFTLKKTSSIMAKSDEYKIYFDNKLKEYAVEGKQNKVDEILSIYADLYILSMKYD